MKEKIHTSLLNRFVKFGEMPNTHRSKRKAKIDHSWVGFGL